MALSRETMLWPAEGSRDQKLDDQGLGLYFKHVCRVLPKKQKQKDLKHLKHSAAREFERGLS